MPFYGWHYPPFFLAVAVLVAAVPYAFGLALWLAASLAAYLAAIRAILPRPETLLIAAAFPAVFINIGHGQNGFLTAALLGGALHWLDRRPWLAGILIGLLAYKPQFGVMIPLALLAIGDGAASAPRRHRRGAGRGQPRAARQRRLACLCRFHELHPAVVLEQGGTGWEKIQSVFSAARNWGATCTRPMRSRSRWRFARGNPRLALAQRCGIRTEGRCTCLGSLLATPYVLDYDLVVLAVAIAFLARHGLARGFREFEISLLAAAWIVPLLSRGIAGATGIPLGLIAMLALYAFVLHRAAVDRVNPWWRAPRIAQV